MGCKPKISYFIDFLKGFWVSKYEYIFWFKIPMHNLCLTQILKSFWDTIGYVSNFLFCMLLPLIHLILQCPSLTKLHHDIDIFLSPEAILLLDKIRTWITNHIISEFFHNIDFTQNYFFEMIIPFVQFFQLQLLKSNPSSRLMIIAFEYLSKAALPYFLIFIKTIFALLEIFPHLYYINWYCCWVFCENDWGVMMFIEDNEYF